MPCHYLSLLWIYRSLCLFILSKKRLALTVCYASIFLYTCELWQHPHMTSKWTQEQQRQQQQQPAAHNTKREELSIVFFTTHFSSFLPVLLSPRKEIWKNRCCCCCCGICAPSWLCPRSAKNKNFFFPAASSHFFPLFTNFLGVVLLVLSFVHVDGIRPLFRTTRFGWQVMWHCQPFSLRFCFHFSQICNCNEENGICCFYSTNSPLLTETMANEWICHSFFTSFYVDHELEIFYSRPTKDLQIQALSWAWRNVVRPKTRQGSEPRRRNDDTFRVI